MSNTIPSSCSFRQDSVSCRSLSLLRQDQRGVAPTDGLSRQNLGACHSSTRIPPPCSTCITHPDKVLFLKKKCLELWGLSTASTACSTPCPVPISLQHAGLDKLSRDPYVVGAKLDGIRYLLLLAQYPPLLGGQEVAVMINRRWDMYPLHVSARRQHYVRGSLFDGELTMVNLPDTEDSDHLVCSPTSSMSMAKGQRQTYFVFDAIAIRGELVGQTHAYGQRCVMLKELFFCGNEDIDMLRSPRDWRDRLANQIALTEHRIVCQGNPHFLGFFTKQWFPMKGIETLLRCLDSAQTQAPCDGVIFMPLMEPVGVRRQESLFKWKETHTIDLVVQAMPDAMTLDQPGVVPNQPLLYYDGQEQKNVSRPVPAPDGLDVRLMCAHTLPPESLGAVCEFKLESVQALPAMPQLSTVVPDSTPTPASYILFLSFVCARTDKEHPNDARTVRATVDNFMNPVTREQIIWACENNAHHVDFHSS